MRVGHLGMVIAALSFVAGCSSQDVLTPPVGFADAAATRSCGPTDGPAVAIYLAPVAISALEPATPYIRVDLWKPAGALVGTWTLLPSSANGIAARFLPPPGGIETAVSGRVTVTSVGTDSTITGSVDLQFPSDQRVRGGFSARWITRTFLCG